LNQAINTPDAYSLPADTASQLISLGGTISSPRDRSPWTSQRQPLGTGTDRYGSDVVYSSTSATADSVASGTQHSEFGTCNDPTSSMSAQYGSSHTHSLTSGVDDVSSTVCTEMYIADDAIYTSGTRSRSESAGLAVHTRTSRGTSPRPRMSPIGEHTSSVRPRPDTVYALRSAPRAPPPSEVTHSSDDSDDDDYPAPGQSTHRPSSVLSHASTYFSHSSHHSDAMQLASTLADALKDQLKQACERQQRLDQERAAAAEHQRQERAAELERQQRDLDRQQQERLETQAREQRERAAVYQREQEERRLLFDKEERDRRTTIYKAP